MTTILLTTMLLLATVISVAQNSREAGEEKWGVVLEHTEMKNVIVKPDIVYFKDEKRDLKLDIYFPPKIKPGEKRPTIIFLPETRKDKSMEIYTTWPRLVAAYGFIGISVNTDSENYKQSVSKIFEFIAANGNRYQIDTALLSVFSASHVPEDVAASLVRDNLYPELKAVVFYYRNPTLRGPFRKDLPVLYVTDDQIYFKEDRFSPVWNEVQRSKAPWTLVFGKDMPHFFDAYADNDDAKKIIRQTIYFWKNILEPIPAPSRKSAEDREMIAALYSGDQGKAIDLFKSWIEKNPDDQYALLKYGMLSFLTKKYEEAEKAYSKVNKLTAADMIDFSKVLLALDKQQEAGQLITKAIDLKEMNRSPYPGIGSFLYSLGKHKDGIAYYEKAVQEQPRGVEFYNLARGYAIIKNSDKGFEALNKAADLGYNSRKDYEKDADLELLRSDERWKLLLVKLKD